MNFADFQQFRTRVLAERPELRDLAETNVWRSLSSLVPNQAPGDLRHIHRCHLAEQWTKVFQLPEAETKCQMITGGVRNSLSILFQELARRKGTLLLPEDVYPVYGQLANVAELRQKTFQTLGGLQLSDEGDWLLISNPLKPAGRWLSDEETDQLLHWLSIKFDRRLLLDAVYNIFPEFHSTTRRLLQSGQTFLMHSLSKAWLSPLVMGTCWLPECERETLTPVFRSQSPSQENLQKAWSLLTAHESLPRQVDAEVSRRRELLVQSWRGSSSLHERPPLTSVSPAGYLTTLNVPFETLLSQHNILAIPPHVFGSTKTDTSIVSCLRCDG